MNHSSEVRVSRKTLQTLENSQSPIVATLTKSCQIPIGENVTPIGIA